MIFFDINSGQMGSNFKAGKMVHHKSSIPNRGGTNDINLVQIESKQEGPRCGIFILLICDYFEH